MTHEGTPWKTTPRNEIISKDKIKEYFKTKIGYDWDFSAYQH